MKRERFGAYLRRELLAAHVPLDDVDAVVTRIIQRAAVEGTAVAMKMIRGKLLAAGFRLAAVQPNGRESWDHGGYQDADDGLDDLLE